MKRKLKLYAPKWMAESAQQEYKRVLPLLLDRKTFTEADLTTLEAYCVAYGVFKDAQQQVNEKGMIGYIQGAHRPSAAIKLQFEAMSKVRSLAIELGLTPLSRSKAKRADSDDDSGGLDGLDL